MQVGHTVRPPSCPCESATNCRRTTRACSVCRPRTRGRELLDPQSSSRAPGLSRGLWGLRPPPAAFSLAAPTIERALTRETSSSKASCARANCAAASARSSSLADAGSLSGCVESAVARPSSSRAARSASELSGSSPPGALGNRMPAEYAAARLNASHATRGSPPMTSRKAPPTPVSNGSRPIRAAWAVAAHPPSTHAPRRRARRALVPAGRCLHGSTLCARRPVRAQAAAAAAAGSTAKRIASGNKSAAIRW
eukprot:scaffold135566_cov28-Tisochrysis_lutea.AAC.1